MAGPSHRGAGLPVSLAFSAAAGPRILSRLVPADSGVKCRGEFLPSAFPPILCVEAPWVPCQGGAAGDAVPRMALGGAVQAGGGRTGLPAGPGLVSVPPSPSGALVRGAVVEPGVGGHRSSAQFCAAVRAVGVRPISRHGCFRMQILRPGAQSQPGWVWGGPRGVRRSLQAPGHSAEQARWEVPAGSMSALGSG